MRRSCRDKEIVCCVRSIKKTQWLLFKTRLCCSFLQTDCAEQAQDVTAASLRVSDAFNVSVSAVNQRSSSMAEPTVRMSGIVLASLMFHHVNSDSDVVRNAFSPDQNRHKFQWSVPGGWWRRS